MRSANQTLLKIICLVLTCLLFTGSLAYYSLDFPADGMNISAVDFEDTESSGETDMDDFVPFTCELIIGSQSIVKSVYPVRLLAIFPNTYWCPSSPPPEHLS